METKHAIISEEKETGRVEAFSDGVFAIAITLLILDLKVPRASDMIGRDDLVHYLLAQWPTYLAYITSFLSILIMWVNHHRVFQSIRRADQNFLIINGLLLMGITVLPYPTSLYAAFMRCPEARVAAAVYSGTSLYIAIVFNLLWHYACKDQRLLAANHRAQVVTAISRQYALGPAVYFIAFLTAFVNPTASFGICTALVIFFALPFGERKSRSAAP